MNQLLLNKYLNCIKKVMELERVIANTLSKMDIPTEKQPYKLLKH
jgi:hypothetical protein